LVLLCYRLKSRVIHFRKGLTFSQWLNRLRKKFSATSVSG